MRLSDLYIDEPSPAKITRNALKLKSKEIKELIGKCEYCNKKFPVHHLHLHHLSEVSRATFNRDKNTPQNLMVLCLFHHADAHLPKDNPKNISKDELVKKVGKRSIDKNKIIMKILKNRKKTTDDNSGGLILPPLYGKGHVSFKG
jgi:hypothetical protein